jgi:hypothetical protein
MPRSAAKRPPHRIRAKYRRARAPGRLRHGRTEGKGESHDLGSVRRTSPLAQDCRDFRLGFVFPFCFRDGLERHDTLWITFESFALYRRDLSSRSTARVLTLRNMAAAGRLQSAEGQNGIFRRSLIPGGCFGAVEASKECALNANDRSFRFHSRCGLGRAGNYGVNGRTGDNDGDHSDFPAIHSRRRVLALAGQPGGCVYAGGSHRRPAIDRPNRGRIRRQGSAAADRRSRAAQARLDAAAFEEGR